MEKVTDLIRRLRAHGLSQTEIAKRIGIPQSKISRWEGGCAPTSADEALRLAALVKEVETYHRKAKL